MTDCFNRLIGRRNMNGKLKTLLKGNQKLNVYRNTCVKKKTFKLRWLNTICHDCYCYSLLYFFDTFSICRTSSESYFTTAYFDFVDKTKCPKKYLLKYLALHSAIPKWETHLYVVFVHNKNANTRVIHLSSSVVASHSTTVDFPAMKHGNLTYGKCLNFTGRKSSARYSQLIPYFPRAYHGTRICIFDLVQILRLSWHIPPIYWGLGPTLRVH